MLMTVLISLFFAYAGSYYRLSRRGLAEARNYGFKGFLYVPFDDAARTQDLTRHDTLAIFYSPLNGLDCIFCGGQPLAQIMFGLSGGRSSPESPSPK